MNGLVDIECVKEIIYLNLKGSNQILLQIWMNIVLLMNLATVNAVKREPVSEPVER